VTRTSAGWSRLWLREPPVQAATGATLVVVSRADDGMAETAPASGEDTTVDGRGRAGRAAGSPGPAGDDGDVGSSLGRYQIIGLLGAGGMGRVYRARDPDLNRELAIKVLRRAPGSGSGGLEHRLLREAQAMAKLNHPNLATVYDVGSVGGEVFIAFELIDGGTLGAWARGGRSFAERLAALIAAGRGLEAAHSAGVIHRDFKPDNVLVGRDGVVKVVDFGLARGVGAGAAPDDASGRGDALSVELTLTGSILGTPAYMAPEQHHGAVADARADQFGFAVSAWEILYGRRPFAGKTLEALATAIGDGEIEPPPVGGDVPAAIEPVLRRALAVEPDRRYPDMGVLLAALAEVAAPPPAARRRWGLIVAALGVGAVAVTAGVLVTGRDPSTPAAAPASLTPIDADVYKMAAGPYDGGPIAVAGRDDGDDDRTEIRNVIRASIGKVGECYERAVADQLDQPAGRVTIEFEIAASGRVISTRIASDEFDGRGGIAACVASRSLEWQFPSLRSGTAVKISYPFDFAPIATDVALVEPGRYRVARATWTSWMSDRERIARGVRPVPALVHGRQIGWKLFSIKAGSVHALLGFESGDTITHVDGKPLDGVDSTAAAIAGIDPSRPVEIRFRRRGVDSTHVYEIGP